jgi:hypothetical protein
MWKRFSDHDPERKCGPQYRRSRPMSMRTVSGRRSCAPGKAPGRDRGRSGGLRPGAFFTNGQSASMCSAVSSAMCWSRPAGLRLRGDPMRLLFREAASRRPTPSPPSTPTSARHSRRRRASFRHPRRARVHARQADRPQSGKCWPDRLIGDPAEHLSLRRQQPVRRIDRQAAVRRDTGFLSHPVDHRMPVSTRA